MHSEELDRNSQSLLIHICDVQNAGRIAEYSQMEFTVWCGMSQ